MLAFSPRRSAPQPSHIPTLDREEERELAKRWHEGDGRAAERIVVACLPFVVAIALQYRKWGVPLEDIVQQGNVGLLRAAKKFDPEKDCRLATYAAYWIRAEIRDFVIRSFRVVRLGTTKSERRALRAFRTTRDASLDDLAALSGLTRERIEQLIPILAAKETSLSAPLARGGDGQDQTLLDRLTGNAPSPEEDACQSELHANAKHAVNEALTHLNARERVIVNERMLSDDPITLQALGHRLGVSKERVRQIEERAKNKLRQHLRPAYEEYRETA